MEWRGEKGETRLSGRRARVGEEDEEADLEGAGEEGEVGLLVEELGDGGFEGGQRDGEGAEKADGGFEGRRGGVRGGEETRCDALPHDGGLLQPCG